MAPTRARSITWTTIHLLIWSTTKTIRETRATRRIKIPFAAAGSYRLVKSVPEMPHPGEHHGQPGVIRSLDHLVVTHRATGLNDTGGTRRRRFHQAIGKGEEGVGRHRAALGKRL